MYIRDLVGLLQLLRESLWWFLLQRDDVAKDRRREGRPHEHGLCPFAGGLANHRHDYAPLRAGLHPLPDLPPAEWNGRLAASGDEPSKQLFLTLTALGETTGADAYVGGHQAAAGASGLFNILLCCCCIGGLYYCGANKSNQEYQKLVLRFEVEAFEIQMSGRCQFQSLWRPQLFVGRKQRDLRAFSPACITFLKQSLCLCGLGLCFCLFVTG
eukprot:s8968_g1.t1